MSSGCLSGPSGGSRKYQGEKYGELLLAEDIHRTALIADQVGVIGLFVDVKDNSARYFYEHYEFVVLPGEICICSCRLRRLDCCSQATIIVGIILW